MTQARKDVLNGWKEIAAYLGRDPRTVERWEKTRSLPVRRLPGSGRATVYALVPELDAWLRKPSRGTEQTIPLPPTQTPEPLDSGPASGDSNVPVVAFQAEPQQEFRTATRSTRSRDRTVLTAVLAIVVLIFAVAGTFYRRHQRRVELASSPIPHTRPLVPPSSAPGVVELYLRGSYQTELRTPESLRHAQESFGEALRRDPRYAPALAGLATTDILLREYSTVPDREAYEQARSAASRAASIDPNLPQAHAVLGFVDFFWDWDATEAQKEFQIALRLAPNLPLAHHWYGSMLTHQGHYQEALRELDAAQNLEPSSSAILTTRALALGLEGHRQESSDMLNEAITEHGGSYHNPATMHQVMAVLSLLTPRDIPRFLAEDTLAAELRQDAVHVKTLRKANATFRAEGEHAMWQALLKEEERSQQGKGPNYAMARYEAELGARDQALSDLSKLAARHDPAVMGIAVDPLLADLRLDPRFAKLRRTAGL